MLTGLITSLLLAFGAFSSASAQQPQCEVDYTKSTKSLQLLEEKAGRGALMPNQINCLESAYAMSEKITTKDKISRVLLINAYAYDTRNWAKLVGRHLQEVDQSDPAIAYLYTFYLNNRKKPDHQAIIKWSETSLERRAEWKGKTYTNRTFQLLKVRAVAATNRWADTANNGDTERAEEQRLEAKTFAREFLDFAKSADMETQEAAQLCITAASKEACGITE